MKTRNTVERAITPYNPSTSSVLQKDKYNLYSPTASAAQKGLAQFAAEDFSVSNGLVKIGNNFRNSYVRKVNVTQIPDDIVYNDFYIGEGADVTIIAGCGIHNCGVQKSEHDGVHSFYVGKNAKVRYIERHYGEGDGNGENVMNPTTVAQLAENAYMEMETTQIKGIDSTIRKTTAKLAAGASIVIREKIMTHGRQFAKTEFTVDLDGDGSGANVISRSVAKESSKQVFISNIRGNAKCSGHSECDAIIMDDATVSALPEITASCVDASLIHEAAIGKIAGEQITKLMTLGLTEKEAEEQIISGFLK